MFAAKRHLDDRALVRRYLADCGLDALDAGDEPVLRHLARCAVCDARYAELRRSFDQTRATLIDEADAAISADRLAAQHDRIMRRIDAQLTGPRVLPFPAGATQAHAAGPLLMRRWVAAAAVAGLVIGVTAGRFLHFGGQDATAAGARAAAAAPARSTPVLRAVNVARSVDENELLSEVDVATAAPRTAELRAIYAFTLEASRDAAPLRVKKN